MANPKGIVTRKDMFSDDALDFGKEYSKNIQTAIDANKVLVDSVKELNKQVQNFKVANNQKDYITAKQAEALATQQAIDAIKKQEAAEISADKVKRSAIATMEAERKAKQAVTDAENKAQKAKEASVKLTVEERLQNELNNKALKQEALERLGLVGAYQKLSKERSDAARKLRDLIASESASTEEIKKAQKEFETLNNKVRSADAAVGDFTKNVGRYPLGGFVNGIKNLISAFGVTGGITAFATIMKSAYDEVKKFEQGVADLSAITGASGKDLDYLRNSAIELGKSVKGGAIAVIEAYKLIGSAKPELLDDVKALNAVTEATLTLAKAAGMEMPEAATALTDAMNQFNAPAEQAGVFVDALANGAKYGAAEIPQVTEALLKFGAVARSSNVNIKESTALIELLAENGIKGADAGTALRNVLLKISAPDALPREAQKAMKDLGISFELLKDKSVPIQQKFEALKPLLADNGKLLKAFGFENVVAAQNIIEHTDRLKVLTSKMGEFGTAQEQADIRMNTLQGDTDKMSSTYDSLVLSIGSGSGVITSFFRFFVQGTTDALNGLIRLNSSWDDLFNKAKDEGAKSGKRLFDERFNAMIGDSLSDEQRQKIRDRIKEINDEIAKGSKNSNLKIEKADLLKSLGTGDDLEVSKSIAKAAETQAKLYASELAKLNKKLRETGDATYGLNFGESPKSLKKKKEDLIKALAEQNAIVEENNKKVRASRIKVDPNLPADKTNTGGETDAEKRAREKALKDKLDAEKRLSDALYELRKQRLEQTIKFNEEIASDDTQSDEVRIKALENSQQKQIELTDLTKKHLLDVDKFVLEKDKLNANEKIRIKEDAANKITDIEKKTAKEIEKINQFDEAKYQKELEDRLSKLNVEQNGELEAENKRFKALGNLEKLKHDEREKALDEHEKKLFEIKKKYAIEALKLQIKNLETELAASDLLPINERLSAEKRQKIAETLSKAKLDLSEVEISNNTDKNHKTVEEEKLSASKILDISAQLTAGLSDLANAVFERKIQNIEEEITKNNEYYDKQIELAGNDQRQKDLLQKERDKKNEELEKKKRKEQHKQAVFNKASAVAQAGISTALAILAALNTQPFLPLGPTMAALAGVMGAIQIGAILATPIPKYKGGRNGGKEEFAYVGDGGVSEVIERKRGGIEITPATDTLVKLYEGDKVHSSVDAYNKLQRAAMMASIDMQGRKMSDFQATQYFESNNKELLEELKRNTRAIEKNKSNIVFNAPKLDINHHLWKMKNTNWNN
jgi:TP901 family phage tail tape measure protein